MCVKKEDWKDGDMNGEGRNKEWTDRKNTQETFRCVNRRRKKQIK